MMNFIQQMFFLFTSIILFLLVPNSLYAQDLKLESPYACPDFEFKKEMQKGQTDEDVYVMQQILNLDKRTLIANSGPGSKGQETAFFGNATRDALKRFQALFIEYIEIAHGRFDEKTRVVMNSVCKEGYFTNFGQVTSENTEVISEKVLPIVGISGPETIEINTPFRSYIAASEAIKTPSLTSIIVEGATIGDMRKISNNTFSFLVTPNEDNIEKISLQIEADGIEDLAGNKNEAASNEWIITLVSDGTIEATTTDTSILNDILNAIPLAPAATDCSKVAPVSIYDYSNPCYGKTTMIPDANSGGTSNEQQDSSMLTNILSGLLVGANLFKNIGGLGSAGSKLFSGGAGGQITTFSPCACATARKTFLFIPLVGIGGYYFNDQNPAIITGCKVVGFSPIPNPASPLNVCGQSMVPPTKKGCPPNSIPYGGGCCLNPQFNSLSQPVLGFYPPPGIMNCSI